MQIARSLLLSVVAGLSFLGSIAAAEPQPSISAPPLSPEIAEAAIRGVYQRIVDLVKASGYDLEIELSDVRTYTVEELDAFRYSDLMTLPGCGATLMISPLTMRSPRLRNPRSHISPEWSPESPCSEEVDSLGLMSFREIRELVAEMGEETWSSVTSAAVRVTFDGRERRYRSMVNWSLRGEEGGTLPQDSVIENIHNAIQVEGEIVPFPDMVQLHGWAGLPDEPDYISPSETWTSGGI